MSQEAPGCLPPLTLGLQVTISVSGFLSACWGIKLSSLGLHIERLTELSLQPYLQFWLWLSKIFCLSPIATQKIILTGGDLEKERHYWSLAERVPARIRCLEGGGCQDWAKRVLFFLEGGVQGNMKGARPQFRHSGFVLSCVYRCMYGGQRSTVGVVFQSSF